jgi:YfiH family protein
MKLYHSISELEETGLVQATTSIRHGGISLEPYHSLNLGGGVGDECANVLANKRILFEQVGLELSNLVYCRQIHSADVICVDRFASSSQTHIAEADAMITTRFNLALGVFTADCIPVFILDPVTPAIGIAHAGWRGTLAGIADKTINAMQHHFGTSPSDCIVHLGPSIQRCCYIVSEELADQFERAFGASVRSGSRALSLQDANVRQLTQLGVSPHTISVSPFCTACRTDLFYSHRAEEGKTGRMLSFIRLRCIEG